MSPKRFPARQGGTPTKRTRNENKLEVDRRYCLGWEQRKMNNLYSSSTSDSSGVGSSAMPLRMPPALLLLLNIPIEPLPLRWEPLERGGDPLPPPSGSSPTDASMSLAREDILDDTPSTLEETPCAWIVMGGGGGGVYRKISGKI